MGADRVQQRAIWLITGAILALVSGCGAVDTTLLGQRIDIRQGVATVSQNRAAPINLPRQVVSGQWTHRAANPAHRIPHAAMAARPAALWSAPIGQANDRRHRITAEPVSDGQRIFTIDSRALVSATSTSGATIWSRDLTPPSDRSDDGSGGGLAVAGARVFVVTGFGDLYALDAVSGTIIWRQRLEAPGTGAPTVVGGQVYVTTRNSRGWVLDVETGRLQWQVEGAPSPSGISGGSGPAVGDTFSVFPFGSGQLTATYRREGFEAWQSSVTGGRLGRAYARITDVTGDPVISGGRVYVGNPGGRIVALDVQSGDRLWSAGSGALGPVVPAGGSVFAVNDLSQLIRLDASTGAQIWATDLPGMIPVRNENRRRDIFVHYGPLLAGGALWVASDDGFLRSFDPVSGSARAEIALGAGAASRPIIVAQVLYVVTTDGQLRAFR